MLTTDCGDHVAIYTNIESLYGTPETNIMYVNYTSKKIFSKCVPIFSPFGLRISKLVF